MSWLLSIIGFVDDVVQWFLHKSERDAGKAEQLATDQQKTIAQLEAELNAASQRPDANELLKRGDF